MGLFSASYTAAMAKSYVLLPAALPPLQPAATSGFADLAAPAPEPLPAADAHDYALFACLPGIRRAPPAAITASVINPASPIGINPFLFCWLYYSTSLSKLQALFIIIFNYLSAYSSSPTENLLNFYQNALTA